MKVLRGAWVGVAAASLLVVGCGSDDASTGDGASDAADAADGADGPGPTTTAGSSGSGNSGSEGGSTDTGVLPPDTVPIELRIDEFNIPPTETFYACFEFTFTSDTLAHIVGFRALIDNAAFVHHYVLTMVDGPSGQGQGYSCFDLDGDAVWGWAPGQTEFLLPQEAGFLIGDRPGGEVTFRLQVHYNNPLLTLGETDSSGLELLVTNMLRPNNAGSLTIGDISPISIPPGDPAYEHIATCTSSMSQAVFSDGPINVFSAFLHAHDIGSVLWTDVLRNGEFQYELNRDDPFLFDNQNFKPVDYVIEPGDEIVNHCVYDSTSRTEVTNGGPGTADEMCWDTIMYYPKVSSGIDYCGRL